MFHLTRTNSGAGDAVNGVLRKIWNRTLNLLLLLSPCIFALQAHASYLEVISTVAPQICPDTSNNELTCVLSSLQCAEPFSAACCTETLDRMRGCYGSCGAYDGKTCYYSQATEKCEVVKSVMNTTRTWNCHCSKCVLQMLKEELLVRMREDGGNSFVQELKTKIVGFLTQEAKLSGDSSVILNKSYMLNSEIKYGGINVFSIKKLDFEGRFCGKRPPQITGLDPAYFAGTNFCLGNDANNCVRFVEGQDFQQWIDQNSAFFAFNDSCSVSYSFSVPEMELVVPLLSIAKISTDSPVQAARVENLEFGILMELVVPFEIGFKLTFAPDRCSFLSRDDIVLKVETELQIRPTANPATMREFRLKLLGDHHKVLKRYVYLFSNRFETKVKERLTTNQTLHTCFESLAATPIAVSCTAVAPKTTSGGAVAPDSSFKLTCSDIPALNTATCADVFGKTLGEITVDGKDAALEAGGDLIDEVRP